MYKKYRLIIYRTEKCFKKTNTIVPLCCTYSVHGKCKLHPSDIPIDQAPMCGKCLTFFSSQRELDYHNEKCLITDSNYRPVVLPEKGEHVHFHQKRFVHTYKLPVVFVADFESILVKTSRDSEEECHKEGSKLWKEEKHIPCSFGIYVITQEGVPEKNYFTYTGENSDDLMDAFAIRSSNLVNFIEIFSSI